MSLGSDQPKLTGILLGDSLKHVVEKIECFFVFFLTEATDNLIVRILVDIERTEAYIRQIRLTACITLIVSIRTLEVFVVRELIPWVKNFVSMHRL